MKLIEVACAVIIKNNKVLVTQRGETMVLPLKWEFPGGKIEKDETSKTCLIREIQEELDIEINIGKKLNDNTHNYGSFSIKLIPYLATIQSGEIKLSEHKTYRFVKTDHLLNLDWAEADLPIVHQLLNKEL